MGKASAALPRRSRKCGQFAKVARVMLDNHRGLEIRREFLDAINRGQRFSTIDVEDGYTARLIVFTEVRKVAAQQHIACLRQLWLRPD